jgi:hypothetical protein
VNVFVTQIIGVKLVPPTPQSVVPESNWVIVKVVSPVLIISAAGIIKVVLPLVKVTWMVVVAVLAPESW